VHSFGVADAVYRPPAEAHANAAGCRGANIVLVEACEARLAAFERAGMPVNMVKTQRSALAAAIGSQIREELVSPRVGSAMVLEGLALQLWGEVLVPRTSPLPAVPAWLLQIRNVVSEDPHRRLAIEKLAEIAGVSISHLSKSAKAYFGCSRGGLRRQLQVERATQLLAETYLPIAEVALACGFYDQSHLTRAFSRKAGCTPAIYRRNLGESARESFCTRIAKSYKNAHSGRA
jgi:AraC family transcriptional regulator